MLFSRSMNNQSDSDTAPSVLVERNKLNNYSPNKNTDILLKVPIDENKEEKVREPGKTLRSYHSTPDCKQSSVLSISSVSKSSSKKITPLCRRNLG